MKQVKSSTIIALITYFYIIITSQILYSQTGWVNQYYNSGAKPIEKVFFIDENTGWAISGGGCTYISCGGLFRTTNGGANWTMLFYNSISYNSFDFINNSTGWMVGVYFDDIMGRGKYYYKTTNGGINWILKLQDSLNGAYNCVCFINASTGWIAGAFNNEGLVMRSTDSGETWNNYAVPITNSLSHLLFVNFNVKWAVGAQGNILTSTNSGINWLEQANTGNSLNFVDFIDLNTGWVVGNNGMIYKTTNSGINWLLQTSGIYDNLSSVCFVNSETGWCSGKNGNILFTSNGGSNWNQQVSNTIDDLHSIYFININTGWTAGGFNTITGSCSVFKTTTGGLIPVKPLGEKVPNKFSLNQNYPNPFNPITKIKFDVPKSENLYLSSLHLTVYDVLGREITQLVNESNLKPGTYEVEWDASNFASGIYFYKSEAGDYNETRKMVLIK